RPKPQRVLPRSKQGRKPVSRSTRVELLPKPNGLSRKLTREDIPELRSNWFSQIKDLTGPFPPGLPPGRGINHAIPLIDENKPLRRWHARCPDILRPELMKKLE